MHSHSLENWTHDHNFLGAQHARNERRTWIVAGVCVLTLAAQIALILGRRSPNAARMAVTRAVNRLIEHMSDEGGEPK